MYTLHDDFLPLDYHLELVSKLPPLTLDYYDRYDNPFERKWVLKRHLANESIPILQNIYHLMERQLQRLHPLALLDPYNHFSALMIYELGDYTKIHVDAGVHPISKFHKYVTAVLYLTEADIEFWIGSSCVDPNPTVIAKLDAHLDPRMMITFNNTDTQWHAVPTVIKGPRIAITISGVMLDTDTELLNPNQYRNQRERAYFIPNPDETWDEATVALRDKRADLDKYHEVYRI